MRRLLVAIFISLAAVAAMAAVAMAVETKLVWSHVCRVNSTQVEVHFVLVDPPTGVTNWGTVHFTVTVPGGAIVTGTAGLDSIQGNNAHYRAQFNGGAGVYSMTAAVLTIITTSGPQTFTLSNAGAAKDTAETSCVPTAVTITSVKATSSEDHIFVVSLLGLGLAFLVFAAFAASVKRR